MQQQSDKIIRLQGKVQHYAWGGAEFIPGLLGISNEQKKPFAEYWMGAHPSAPSELISSKGNQSLYEAISYHPVTMLGEKVYQAFGELPYLFKVLDTTSTQSRRAESAIAGGARDESVIGARAATTGRPGSVVTTVSPCQRTPTAPAAGRYSTSGATAAMRSATSPEIRRRSASRDSCCRAAASLGGAALLGVSARTSR